MKPLTERTTVDTSCPGDCAQTLARDQGSSRSDCGGVRGRDCSARTCRTPACTEPEAWLIESANGSVASWQCFGSQLVSSGAWHPGGSSTGSGVPEVVPTAEAPAAVAVFGLERGNGDDGGGPQESGSVTLVDRPLARASGRAADCGGERRRAMAGGESRPPRRP